MFILGGGAFFLLRHSITLQWTMRFRPQLQFQKTVFKAKEYRCCSHELTVVFFCLILYRYDFRCRSPPEPFRLLAN